MIVYKKTCYLHLNITFNQFYNKLKIKLQNSLLLNFFIVSKKVYYRKKFHFHFFKFIQLLHVFKDYTVINNKKKRVLLKRY